MLPTEPGLPVVYRLCTRQLSAMEITGAKACLNLFAGKVVEFFRWKSITTVRAQTAHERPYRPRDGVGLTSHDRHRQDIVANH